MSAAMCPYCRAAVEQSEATLCQGCGTPHHLDCFEENGGCTVFGCSAAPPAEPKLSIDTPDLHRLETATDAPPVSVIAAPAPPPPPLAGAIPPAAAVLPQTPLFSSTGYNSYRPSWYPQVQAAPASARLHVDPSVPAKNRTTFLLLGVLLGPLGVHSFYAGATRKGLLQLGITVFTLGFAGLMVWIWAIIDICTITTDNNGVPFRN